MFSIVDHPVHFPGRTAVIGDTRGPVIDLGVDWNGWIYLNEIESIEIGKKWGMVEGNVHEQTLGELDDERARVVELALRVTELEAAQPKVLTLADVQTLLGNWGPMKTKSKAA